MAHWLHHEMMFTWRINWIQAEGIRLQSWSSFFGSELILLIAKFSRDYFYRRKKVFDVTEMGVTYHFEVI